MASNGTLFKIKSFKSNEKHNLLMIKIQILKIEKVIVRQLTIAEFIDYR